MTRDEPGGPPPIEMPSVATIDGAPAPTSLTLAFRGEGSDLFLLMLKNLLLTLVTFGIYASWARTAKRAYLWKQVEVGGAHGRVASGALSRASAATATRRRPRRSTAR